jgi:hypothetical protein
MKKRDETHRNFISQEIVYKKIFDEVKNKKHLYQ